MKKIILSIVVLLVVVVAGNYFYQASKVVEPVAVVPEVKEVTPPVVVEQPILLYPESGEVTFKTTPNDDFQKASTSPTVIPNKAIVHTGVGKASVLLPDNSTISLDSNTEITVNYTEKDISIYQTLGTTYHRVEALLTGKTYQVQTAGTLAAVRGTKFAVKYDLKTKKTKIAVTEHKVEVSTIPKAVGTSTPPAPEVVMVEEGKMVSVIEEVKSTGTKPTPMQVIDTTKDKEMNTFIDLEKKIDVQMDTIKKEAGSQEEFRKEMKKVMFNDEDNGAPKNLDETTNDTKTDETKSETKQPVTNETVKPKVVTPVTQTETTRPKTEETTRPVVNTTTSNTSTSVIKMGEEEFFNEFEPLFIKYFYLDETDLACTEKVSPQTRVDTVTSFAKKNGYPFTKPTLLSFANAIDAYCISKDSATKLKLQSRFDDEYPFSE